MSDAFDEVDDDLRHAKLKAWWKENGPWIIGGAVAAIFLTGGMSFWRHWEYTRNTEATAELTRLVEQADISKIENFVKKTDKKHSLVAQFRAAGMYLEKDQKDKAIEIYQNISNGFAIDKTWKDLATVLSLSQRLDQDDPETLRAELAALSDTDSVWRYTVWEMEALLAARENKVQEALLPLTKIIADPQAPQNSRARAFRLRELYMADKSKT